MTIYMVGCETLAVETTKESRPLTSTQILASWLSSTLSRIITCGGMPGKKQTPSRPPTPPLRRRCLPVAPIHDPPRAEPVPGEQAQARRLWLLLYHSRLLLRPRPPKPWLANPQPEP